MGNMTANVLDSCDSFSIFWKKKVIFGTRKYFVKFDDDYCEIKIWAKNSFSEIPKLFTIKI